MLPAPGPDKVAGAGLFPVSDISLVMMMDLTKLISAENTKTEK